MCKEVYVYKIFLLKKLTASFSSIKLLIEYSVFCIRQKSLFYIWSSITRFRKMDAIIYFFSEWEYSNPNYITHSDVWCFLGISRTYMLSISLFLQSAAKLFEHLIWFVSKNSCKMQFYEINFCQVMNFRLYTVYN